MHIFDQDISLETLEPRHLKARVSPNWLVNDTPNGGYLMAVLANAMMLNSDKKSTPIVTANYISRCVPGEAEILVNEVSKTKQFNRLEARLLQDGREKIRAFGTFSDEKYDCFMERYESLPPDVAAPENCVAIPGMPKYSLLGNVDMRLDPACAGWIQGKLIEKSEHRGWIAFRDERPFDVLSILLMADAFPPPVFASQGMMAWVPTIELSINVRNIPQSKWLKCVFRTRFINCGLCEEDGEVWDEEGGLVAISRQIAQFRKIDA